MKTALPAARMARILMFLAIFSLGRHELRAQTFPEGPTLLQPTNGAVFFAGADIKLSASAGVFVTSVETVNFFADGQLRGKGIPGPENLIFPLSGRTPRSERIISTPKPSRRAAWR